MSGISSAGRAQAVYDSVVSNALSGLTGNVIEAHSFDLNDSEAKQIMKHMDDVEGDGVVDVYELFAVISLVKRK